MHHGKCSQELFRHPISLVGLRITEKKNKLKYDGSETKENVPKTLRYLAIEHRRR